MVSDIIDVDLDDYEENVIRASYHQPVLVDLWAQWCSPCLAIAPVLEALVAGAGGRLKLARVEVDEGENMKLAGRYQVRGFPTILLFVSGQEVARFSGAKPLSEVRRFVEENTGLRLSS